MTVEEPEPMRLAERVRIACSFGDRLRGLMGQTLGAKEGLYITPCSSIHTFAMKVPIDAVFLDAEGKALALYHSLPPWRTTRWIYGADGVLELPAGTLARKGLLSGQKVEMPELNGTPRAATRNAFGRVVTNGLLSAFWLYLAYLMVLVLVSGQASPSDYMLFGVNSLIAVLFLVRRPEKRVSESTLERLITFASIMLSFSLRPAAEAALLPTAVSAACLTFALLLIFLAYLSLGRSFGLIPADRGVKLGGLYRWVRHPLYGAEMLFFGFFLLANFTLRNVLLAVAIYISLDLRARAEERLLSLDPDYQAYCKHVKSRYIPFLV